MQPTESAGELGTLGSGVARLEPGPQAECSNFMPRISQPLARHMRPFSPPVWLTIRTSSPDPPQGAATICTPSMSNTMGAISLYRPGCNEITSPEDTFRTASPTDAKALPRDGTWTGGDDLRDATDRRSAKTRGYRQDGPHCRGMQQRHEGAHLGFVQGSDCEHCRHKDVPAQCCCVALTALRS